MAFTGNPNERGVTLVELLVVFAISAALMAISVVALRHYYWVRSLEGGADEVTSEMRAAQARSMAESHPLVYGVRFKVDSPNWGLVRYSPVTGTCTDQGSRSFDAGVDVAGVDFQPSTLYASDATAVCLAAFPGSEFALFFARGVATAGTVTLRQDAIDRSEEIEVIGLTG